MAQDRVLHHYELLVRAGPGMATCDLAITYYDEYDQEIGTTMQSLFAFGTTWKDAADLLRTRAEALGILSDPVRATSPHLDLT